MTAVFPAPFLVVMETILHPSGKRWYPFSKHQGDSTHVPVLREMVPMFPSIKKMMVPVSPSVRQQSWRCVLLPDVGTSFEALVLWDSSKFSHLHGTTLDYPNLMSFSPWKSFKSQLLHDRSCFQTGSKPHLPMLQRTPMQEHCLPTLHVLKWCCRCCKHLTHLQMHLE